MADVQRAIEIWHKQEIVKLTNQPEEPTMNSKGHETKIEGNPMDGKVDEDLLDIVRSVSVDLGNTLDVSTIRPVSRPTGKEQIKDATLALFVDGNTRRDDIVLLVSNPLFPGVVREAVVKAETVRDLLNPTSGEHIMQPKSVGNYGERTYAAFSRLETISDRRILRWPQTLVLAPRIVSWSADMALQTKAFPKDGAAFSRYFIQPLQFLLDDADTSADLRKFSRECVDLVTRSKDGVFTVVEHGDFWVGNVLFDRTAIPGAGAFLGDFFVIDWRGSRLDGYPCIDVIRFCRSIHAAGSSRSSVLLRSYKARLGIDNFEVGMYCVLGLGRLGMNLEYFPRKRYLTLCREMFLYLRAHGFTNVR